LFEIPSQINITEIMVNNRLRMKVVKALAEDPRPHLEELRQARDSDLERLLLWLDESGLALYFLRRVEQERELASLSAKLQEGLLSRQELNRGRVAEMLREFARVNDALSSAGVRYAVLKGFSLVPDFCPDPDIRHHNDIDVVVHPESLPKAVSVVSASGYRRIFSESPGEYKFILPLPRLSLHRSHIYACPGIGILELHLSACESSPGRKQPSLPDVFEHIATQELRGIVFPVLSMDDKLLVHMLHVFRHLTIMSVRTSWLYELSIFLGTNRCPSWSRRFCQRAGSDKLVRHSCGVTLLLSHNLFGMAIPDALHSWCID